LQKALIASKAVDDKAGSALILNDLAELLRREGKVEAALTTFHQAQANAQEVENKSALGYVLNGIVDVLSDCGDSAGAGKSYEEALTMPNSTGEKQSIVETQVALARHAIDEGRLAEAEISLRKCKDQFHQDAQADDEILASAAPDRGSAQGTKFIDGEVRSGSNRRSGNQEPESLCTTRG
jgi:ATP/maltotriose-dependent transcriptional regulator MalT